MLSENLIDNYLDELSDMVELGKGGYGQEKKYRRISLQEKNSLFERVLLQNKKIKAAASELNINYSSAKTLLFLHRKKIKKSFQVNHEQDQRCHFRKKRERDPEKIDIVVMLAGKIINKNKEEKINPDLAHYKLSFASVKPLETCY